MVIRLVTYLGGRASISSNRFFCIITIFIFRFHMLLQKISFSRGFMGFDFQAHPHPCFNIDYQQVICLSYCTFLHWFTTYFGKFGVMLPLFCFIHFFFGQFILTSKARWRKKLHNLVCSSIMVTRFICLLCGMILASQILLFMTRNRKFKLIYSYKMSIFKSQVNLLLTKWMKDLEKIFYGNIVAYDAAMLPEAEQDELQNVIWR